ncbi:Ig-like domain repeat protein [Salinispora arenicola]|uniref:Alpha-tubulin suppressor-like RCC1 family protein n=3 Tax=Salinispora arenicola TaxID=168697 RepID=A0A542XHF7_SALAC|nr:alpha-tubulin suppressor-like RCC1 family protein [Salinispora arenicola]
MKGSWVRPASLRGLFALPLMVAITLGIASVGAARVLAQGVPSAAAGPPGTGLAWGNNSDGELGDGTNNGSSTPIAVDLPADTTITAIAAGTAYGLALTSAGTVLAWGDNSAGQLGDGTTTDSSTPVTVDLPAGTTITAVAAGDRHSLALTSTGTMLAWGENFIGQLGDGTTTRRSTPVAVDLPAGTTVTAVAAGDRHSLALTSADTVLAWGDNSAGQLGDGTTTDSSTPVTVDLPAGTTITTVAAGAYHSLALTSADTMLAWGYNIFGQLGDGTTTDRDTPVAVDLPAGTTITTVAGGARHTLAMTSAGTMLAWGHNNFGQLGDGTTTDRSTPVAVDLPADTTITTTTTTVAAGAFHSLAVTSAGTMLAWGYNALGQLGDGTTTHRSAPVAVDLPAGTTITAAAGGDFHSLAIVPSTSTTTLQVSPPNPTPDQPVTLTATVTCTASTPTGTVTFLDNTKTLGTEPLPASPTAILTVTRLTPGTHHIHARYNGDNNCPTSTSKPTTVTVPKPTIPVTGASLPTILTAGSLLTLTGAALILAHRRRPAHGA